MTSKSRGNHKNEYASLNPAITSPSPTLQTDDITVLATKRPTVKKGKARPRETAAMQYAPGHISRMFDPQEAIERVTRSKVEVEVEVDDDSDDSNAEQAPEGSPVRPLSVASTGSNIAVFRPPTPSADEIAQAVTKRSVRKGKEQTKQQDFSRRHASPRRTKKPASIITISSRGTDDVEPLDDIAEVPDTPREESAISLAKLQHISPTTSSRGLLEDSLFGDDGPQMPDDMIGDAERSIPSPSVFEQAKASNKSSDFSFATSNGTGLFVSDKKRPKKSSLAVTEGMILGGGQSRISFSTPPPVTEVNSPPGQARLSKAADRVVKKKTKKRKDAPSVNATDSAPGGKTDKRGKGMIDVSDLVTKSSKRKRPSRATMKNGAGLLVGTSSNTDAIVSKPLSWQAKGRGKGVTRAVPLSEMARKSSMGDKK